MRTVLGLLRPRPHPRLRALPWPGLLGRSGACCATFGKAHRHDLPGPDDGAHPVITHREQIVEAIASMTAPSAPEGLRPGRRAAGAGGHPFPSAASEYPHEFSGGMRQRAVIAWRWAMPELLIADDPPRPDVTVRRRSSMCWRASGSSAGQPCPHHP